MQFNKLLGGK